MNGRLALVALLLVGCGSRSPLGTRDASPFVDDDPFLKLDGGAGPSMVRASDGAVGGGPIGPATSPPDASAVSSTDGAERALRDIAKLLWHAEPDPRHLELARAG